MKSETLGWIVVIIIILALGAYALFYSPSGNSGSATSTPSGSSTTTDTSSAATGGSGTATGPVTFYCKEGQIDATFSASAVQLDLSDGRYFALPQVESGSGIRYEGTNNGKDELFQSEGSSATLSENGKATYSNCVAAHVSDAGGGFKTYLAQSGAFSFKYPNTFSIVGTAPGYSTSWAVNATSSGMLLATVQLPSSYMPKTNFAGASFSVGTSADPSALASCLNPAYETRVGSVTINGIQFAKFTMSDAGAGNFYTTTSYRIIRDSQCYALEDTIHSTNIANYPAGTVTAFNQAQVQSLLGGIAASFQFLQ